MESTPYFAYGSNLSAAHWATWSAASGVPPDALRPLEAAHLPDHTLAFNYFSQTHQAGAANVVPELGQAVPGYLFQVSEAGRQALDRKEGHPRVYRRQPCVVLTAAGQEVQAFTYVVTPEHERPHTRPSVVYLGRIQQGYTDRGLQAAGARLDAIAADRAAAPSVAGLFVYGTLRQGEAFEPMLAASGVRSRRVAAAPGTMWSLGTYPGATFWPAPAAQVIGEVVTLDRLAEALPALDRLEDFPGWDSPGGEYRRTLLLVGGRLWWAYEIQQVGGAARMPGGDWLQRSER